MKKVVSLVLCLLLVFSACFVASATGATATLNGANSVEVGENIELVLNLNGCADATSVAVAVSFDTDAFALVSGEWLQAGSLKTYDVATNMGALGGLSAPNVNGDLFKLTLKAIDVKAANVSVNAIAKNGTTEVANIVATKTVKVGGEATITFDTIEEDFDGETVNEMFAEAGTVENGKLVMEKDKQFTVGTSSSENFVFEADVTFDGVIGTKDNANGSNYINFIFGKHQLRYLGTFTRKGSSGDDRYEVTGELMTGLGWQNHDGSASVTETYLNSNKATPGPTEVGAVVRIRIEVMGSTVTAKLFYNDKVYGVIRDRGSETGTLRVKGPAVNGSKVTMDNVKIAYLDTAKATGAIEGIGLSATQVALGTTDNNTGLLYGGEVTYDVFGGEMTTFVGGKVTFEANDGYNVNKVGIRKDVTLKVGDQVLGVYDITYSNGPAINVNEDFSTDFFKGETSVKHNGVTWNVAKGTPTIEDGMLVLPAASVVIGDLDWDNYALEMVVRVKQIPGISFANKGSVSYIGVLNQSTTAAKAMQLRWNPSVVKDGDGLTTGDYHSNGNLQVNNAALNKTGLSVTAGHTTTSGKTTNSDVGVFLNVRVEVIGGTIYYYYKPVDSDNWTCTYTITGFEGKTGNVSIVADSAPSKLEIDSLSIVSYVEDQSPYSLALGEGAKVTFNATTGEIAATGTASAHFYGFKESGTVNLADVVGEMAYTGNGTVKYGEFEIPCEVLGGSKVDYSAGLGDDWSIGTGVTVEGGKVALGASSITYNKAISNNFVVEYDFTPYHLDYMQNPVVSLIFNGSTKTAEFGPYYYLIDKTKGAEGLEAGATAANGADYYWRLMGRSYAPAAGVTHLYPKAKNDVELVANTAYNGEVVDGVAAATPVENPTTYHIRLEVNGRSVKILVDDVVVFDEAEFILEEALGLNKISFKGAAAGTATIENIVVEQIVDASIVAYETIGQAVKVGSSADAIDLSAKAVLGTGYKFDVTADSVTGFDGSKLGEQTVTLKFGNVAVEKTVMVVDYDVKHFESFDGYSGAVSTTGTNGATIKWNTANGTVTDGKMTSNQTFHLVNNNDFTQGVVAMDVSFPSATHTGKYAFALTKLHSVASEQINFGVVFDNVDGEVVSKLFISKHNTVLASCDFDLALDTEYNFEMRIYGNVVKGYVDGVAMVTYVDDGTYSELLNMAGKRVGLSTNGVGGGEIQALITPDVAPAQCAPVVDNVIVGANFATYTVTAGEGVTALQTVAQPGDVVKVSADVNANGVLKANDNVIFKNADTTFGGNGTDYVFTMPAQNVTVTLGEGGDEIATIAAAVRDDNGAVRFLNRLYLPAIEDEEGNTIALDLGDIVEFGALILPKDILDGELTLDTAKAAKAIAYTAEKSVLYDVTGKYVDFVVTVTSKNADREFVCVAYYVTEGGETVYGDAYAQSINGLK